MACNQKECGRRSTKVDGMTAYILNGQVAVRGAYPWQVSIIYEGQTVCGGSIINNRWILTAAHCTVEYKEIRHVEIHAGSLKARGSPANDPDARIYHADKIISHPNYNLSNERDIALHDISLIRLSEPIVFTETIKPVCLADEDVKLDKFKVCVASGFGVTRYGNQKENGILMVGKFRPMSKNLCTTAYKNLTNKNWAAGDYEHQHMFCAGHFPAQKGTDACKGDSGGPFACRDHHGFWTVVGVTSFGVQECQLSVFSRVSAYVRWINEIMARNDPATKKKP